MPSRMCSNEVSCRPAMTSNLPCRIGRNDLCSGRGLWLGGPATGPAGRKQDAGHGQTRAGSPHITEGPFAVDTSDDARRTAGKTPAHGGRLRSLAMIVIFDVAAPLAAYSLLRSAGLTAVTALLLSGVFPVLGVAIGAIRHCRLDVLGALVLAGIVVGTVLGLISHSTRLLL